MLRASAGAVLALLLIGPAHAVAGTADRTSDPLMSTMWNNMRALLLGDAPVVFDDRVVVTAPANAEDAFNLPVTVDAGALGKVEEIVVFADLNPIPHVLTYRPVEARPFIAFRLKIQQATPVRAAARTVDGVWHVGGVRVDAAGGGCTSPALAHGDPTWEMHLGEVQARAWPRGEDNTRLRFRIRHPQDTGLAAGIPAFFIEDIVIRDADGRELGRIEGFEPVSENPVFTVEVKTTATSRAVRLTGRDNNGGEIRADIPLPWQQSALPSVGTP